MNDPIHPASVEASQRSEWWRAPAQFTLHILTGTFLFVVIACAAASLALLVALFERNNLDRVLVWGLKLAEYFLFGFDVLFFLVFLWRSAIRASREL